MAHGNSALANCKEYQKSRLAQHQVTLGGRLLPFGVGKTDYRRCCPIGLSKTAQTAASIRSGAQRASKPECTTKENWPLEHPTWMPLSSQDL
ncbi:unnamed protein product [Protopolystoma xenopodis]|uniref:Uncharacterized protein n=1 Tax=Protopolystoma xenopodis TaxID=117903 RepID=A0A448WKS0_9PLAT|nr:unnamed protein product [Protopolystoma xenopodis]